jgi:hypothetical protein
VGGVGARRDGEERNSAQHQSLHGPSRPGYPRRDARSVNLRNISFFMHGPSRPGYPRRNARSATPRNISLFTDPQDQVTLDVIWGGGGAQHSATAVSSRTHKTRFP